MAFQRLPKGLGTVTKLNGNLRKPYRARKRIGEELTADYKVKYRYRTVGYYATRKEAIEALATDKGISDGEIVVTFKAVYEKWREKKADTLSRSSLNNYDTSFKAFTPIHNRRFSDLKAGDYEAVVAECSGPARRRMCRILLSQLYGYALRHDLAERDVSKLCDFNTSYEKRQKTPFSVDEVRRLWEMRGDPAADLMLVGIYTGFRPAELCELDYTKITDGCFVGGVKTKNGKNRLVPIHPSILSIVEEYRRKSAILGSTRLFLNTLGRPHTTHHVNQLVLRLFPNHTAHELRHSFATYARRSGMDPVMVKRILGHTLTDVTEAVYTHVDADQLKAEMEKYEVK